MTDPRTTTGMRSTAGILLLVAVTGLVLAAYAQVWHHGFLEYDDDLFVTGNPEVQRGLDWPGLKWAFTNVKAALWIPVLWLSHMADVQLFGMHAGWHHLHNLFLHWLNSLLLLYVMQRLTGRIWVSGIVALLFAVHPQHVESVAWVTERKDTLSTAFFLLTILCYHRHVQGGARRFQVAALGFFVLGLLTKPMLVTLPFVLLLLDHWPLGRAAAASRAGSVRTWTRLVAEKLPFLIVALAVAVTTLVVGRSGGIVSELDMVPLKFRLMNVVNGYFEYLRQFFWPHDLHAQYGFEVPLPTVKLVLAAGVLVGVSAIAVRLRRSHPYVLTGWLWYLGTLIPVIGLVQQGAHAMADRYTYISGIGIYLIVAYGVAGIRDRWRVPVPVLAVAVAGAFAALTWVARGQAAYWRDTETLFTRTLSFEPENEFALNKLADHYKRSGRIAEAREMYARSMRVNPHAAHASNNLAGLLADAGEWDQALALYRRALNSDGDAATVHYNMGILLHKMGRNAEAVASYEKALEIEPDHYDAMTNLGLTYLAQERFAAADGQLQAMLRRYPEDALVRYNLACVASRAGRTADALAWLRGALDLGFADWATLSADPDLAALRATEAYRALQLPTGTTTP